MALPHDGSARAPKQIDTELGRFEFWGCDCTSCGSTNDASMYCNECGNNRHTVPLYRPVDGPRMT